MNRKDIEELSEVIHKLSLKHFEDGESVWFGYVKENDDNTYVVNINYKEDFIQKIQTHDFDNFRRDVYLAVDKVFSRNGCGGYIKCKSGCHGCQDKVYKIQFSEEL